MTSRLLLPGLALVVLSIDAQALGIGEVISQPRLGEKLRIEFRLHGDDQPIDPACIRLSPSDVADDLPWVRNARLRVQGGPRPSLIVESGEAVNHPIYMLGLRIGCGAEVRREFTMMPLPPLERQAGETPSGSEQPQPGPVTDDMGSARTGWLIAPGETLATIAAALFPNNPRAQRSFIRESARANPRLFGSAADPARYPLPAGETLALPGTRAAAGGKSVPPQRSAAVRERRRAPPETSAAATTPRDGPDEATSQRKARSKAADQGDRLLVAAAADGESGLKFSTLLDEGRSRGLSEEQRERLRQEQRLIAQLDEKIIASLALAEKIRNMEDYLEKLQGDMSRLDQQMKTAAGTASPAPATATPAATAPAPAPAGSVPAPKVAAATPPRQAGDDSGSNWLTYGLIAAIIALLAAWWWLRGRSRDDESGDGEPEASPETEIPSRSAVPPAAETTLAEHVPTARTELATPLELELGQPGEQDSKIAVAEHDSALELAEIMLSFGRVQGAAQTLTDYIHANPRQAIRPWLKLLEIYHASGMQKDFDATMLEFHQNFNVQSVGWSDYTRELTRSSVEGMPHLIQEVVASWPSRGCLELLQNYLRDNREGTRNGFPLAIADDIAMLVGLLEARHVAAGNAAS